MTESKEGFSPIINRSIKHYEFHFPISTKNEKNNVQAESILKLQLF